MGRLRPGGWGGSEMGWGEGAAAGVWRRELTNMGSGVKRTREGEKLGMRLKNGQTECQRARDGCDRDLKLKAWAGREKQRPEEGVCRDRKSVV